MHRSTRFLKGFSRNKKKYIAVFISAAVLILATVLIKRSSDTVKEPYLQYGDLVAELAEEYSLSKSLVLSVIECESNFDENAVSSAGACGLMQLMPETFEWIMSKKGEKGDIFSPKDNVEAGCRYLSYLFLRFRETETVLAAYNAGEGTVSAWLKSSEYSDDEKTLKQIPFPETRFYVSKVLRRCEYYENALK